MSLLLVRPKVLLVWEQWFLVASEQLLGEKYHNSTKLKAVIFCIAYCKRWGTMTLGGGWFSLKLLILGFFFLTSLSSLLSSFSAS